MVIICDFFLFFLIFSREVVIYVSFPQKSPVNHRYNRRFFEKSQLIVKNAAISTTWELSVNDRFRSFTKVVTLALGGEECSVQYSENDHI